MAYLCDWPDAPILESGLLVEFVLALPYVVAPVGASLLAPTRAIVAPQEPACA